MKNRIRKLTAKEIEILRDRYSSLKFNNDTDLVYESQIPNTGIVLLEGQIALMKRKKVHATVEPGCVIGIHNLIYNEPSQLACKVMSNSELIMLNKSEILEALSDKESELYAIIKDDIA
jgi:CRP-like cAMP-binding protein